MGIKTIRRRSKGYMLAWEMIRHIPMEEEEGRSLWRLL
jgi:hypothetical protein